MIALMILFLTETIGLWFLNNRMNIPSDRIVAARWVFHFSVITFLITVIQVPYNASIIAHEDMSIYAKISIIEALLKLCVVFALAWFDVDKLKLYVFLVLFSATISAIIYRFYCIIRYNECRFIFVRDAALFRKLISFSLWNLFGNAAAVGQMQGVNIVLNLFFGPSVNAARGIAVQVMAAIQSFAYNFNLAVNPQITKLYASNNIEQLRRLVCQSSKLSFYLLLLITLPILMETEILLKLWLKNIPEHTVIFCRLIVANALIDSFSMPLISAVQATGKIAKYQVVMGFIFLMNLPLSYVFLNAGFMPQVTAYISIAVSWFGLLVRLVYLSRILGFNVARFLRDVVFVAIIVVAVAAVLPMTVRSMLTAGIFRLLFVSIVALPNTLLIIYYLGLQAKERDFVVSKVRALWCKAGKFWS